MKLNLVRSLFFKDSGVDELQWHFSQVIGTTDDEVNDADIISTVEFNDDGELLATGDKGGRIFIFQRLQPTKSQPQSSSYLRTDYNVYSTFQSHGAKSDNLKSLETSKKINKTKWLRSKNDAHFLLSTNDKTVKLWEIGMNNKLAVFAKTQAQSNFIYSISLNSNQDRFISPHDTGIILWHIDRPNEINNIVKIKFSDSCEFITAAEFHPKECNQFVYSCSSKDSKGIIRLCDMRQSAQAKIIKERKDTTATTKDFLTPFFSIISDTKFSHCGRYVCTRDFMNLKIWDLRMENSPLKTYPVHDYQKSELITLFNNGCIYDGDKFDCNWSANDEYIISGSYNNLFKSYYCKSKPEFECLQIKSHQLPPKRITNPNRQINVDNLDFKKILHKSLHPREYLLAIAAKNKIYIFYRKNSYAPINMTTDSSNVLRTNSIGPPAKKRPRSSQMSTEDSFLISSTTVTDRPALPSSSSNTACTNITTIEPKDAALNDKLKHENAALLQLLIEKDADYATIQAENAKLQVENINMKDFILNMVKNK